jgi:2-keto-4-pentenoate hydratase/2-oxohepta-3-ene-1,7-dioic acid hydratase in catechol pathway
MYIARFGEAGHEVPAVGLGDGRWFDPSGIPGFDEGELVRNEGISRISAALNGGGLPQLEVDGLRIGAPIPRPHSIICIGLNYADHAAESNMPIPAEPIVFMKKSNTLIGPNDTVHIPRNSVKTDWEVELGIVIGRTTRYLSSPTESPDYIAGYVISNDVSEREFQLERGGQWDKGKSCETFNPCGPWLATADELGDILELDMWLDVNGSRRQTGSTSTMIFDPFFLVHYLSQFMVLEPGDLISTGTPPGVGMGMKPPTYLAAGDVMELGIAGLGSQRQQVIDAP